MAALDDFLNAIALQRRWADLDLVFLGAADGFYIIGAFVGIGLAVAGRLGLLALLLDERFAVGNGNLVVVRMDLTEGQKAVAIATIVDERRLQRRLDPGDFRKIDIAFQPVLGGRLEIKFVKLGAIHHNHPGLFPVGSVYEHAFGH